MKTLLWDTDGRPRNGLWIALFLLLFLLSRLVYTPLVRWLRACGVDELWIDPLKFVFVLLVTWACLRLRHERLSTVGFRLSWSWWRQAAAGLALGAASVVLAVMLMWLAGAVRFEINPAHSFTLLCIGLYGFAAAALFEETLFRGFLFQRLIDGSRPWVAQLVFALLFSTAHWGNPELDLHNMLLATLELFLAALLLGLAYLRTGSLALPFGLHLGWNWMQGSVFGFAVSGYAQSGWLQPQLGPQPAWQSGGQFGLEGSLFAVVVDLLMLALLWHWKPRLADMPRSEVSVAKLQLDAS